MLIRQYIEKTIRETMQQRLIASEGAAAETHAIESIAVPGPASSLGGPLGELDRLAECLDIVEDRPGIAALAGIEPGLPGLMDTQADAAARRMLGQRETLQSALDLEELMPTPETAAASAGLLNAATSYAQAIELAVRQFRRCHRELGVDSDTTFKLPATPAAAKLPPGVRLVGLIDTMGRGNRLPTLYAIRQANPQFVFTAWTFNHAWAIQGNHTLREKLQVLWQNSIAPVNDVLWFPLDQETSQTARAMRALRDWQNAAHLAPPSAGALTAPPGQPASPTVEALRPYADGMSDDPLKAIILFVYPTVARVLAATHVVEAGRRLRSDAPRH